MNDFTKQIVAVAAGCLAYDVAKEGLSKIRDKRVDTEKLKEAAETAKQAFDDTEGE